MHSERDVNVLLVGQNRTLVTDFLNFFACQLKHGSFENALRSEIECVVPFTVSNNQGEVILFGDETTLNPCEIKDYTFKVRGRRLRFIDMPSDDNRMESHWTEVASRYKHISTVVFCFDIYLEPIKKSIDYLLGHLEKSAFANAVFIHNHYNCLSELLAGVNVLIGDRLGVEYTRLNLLHFSYSSFKWFLHRKLNFRNYFQMTAKDWEKSRVTCHDLIERVFSADKVRPYPLLQPFWQGTLVIVQELFELLVALYGALRANQMALEAYKGRDIEGVTVPYVDVESLPDGQYAIVCDDCTEVGDEQPKREKVCHKCVPVEWYVYFTNCKACGCPVDAHSSLRHVRTVEQRSVVDVLGAHSTTNVRELLALYEQERVLFVKSLAMCAIFRNHIVGTATPAEDPYREILEMNVKRNPTIYADLRTEYRNAVQVQLQYARDVPLLMTSCVRNLKNGIGLKHFNVESCPDLTDLLSRINGDPSPQKRRVVLGSETDLRIDSIKLLKMLQDTLQEFTGEMRDLRKICVENRRSMKAMLDEMKELKREQARMKEEMLAMRKDY